MPRRVKDEERIEMIIRGLLKEPENRRCINCNSLGPQYVCTTFWTFICTNCSGVHREFTHRVKSVSMAKFKEDEIIALQAGGNERAREIYFKAWDPQRNAYPDSSNLHRIREFIKHVYVDRKYAGANNQSTLNLDAKNQSNEFEKSSWGSRGDFLTRRCSLERARDGSYEKSSPSKSNDNISFKNMMEERSPRVISTNRSRFEIVDDRFRDDGSVKHYDRCVIKNSRGGPSSPGSQRGNAKGLPEIRTVKDIFGDKFPTLKVGQPPKANDSNAKSQLEIRPVKDRLDKVANATNPGPSDEQNKTVNLSSLIDFDANPEPTYSTSTPSNNNDNAAKMDSMESLLFDLSGSMTPPAAQSNGSNSKGSDVGLTNAHQVSITSQVVADNDLRPPTNVRVEKSSNDAESRDGLTPSGRKELPVDLFNSHFAAIDGWQMSPSHGMGYNMQFHPPRMPVTDFPTSPAKPTNPFDIGSQAQSPMFPSMTPLQGSLPNMPSPYATHVPPYGVNTPLVHGAYMGQQLNNVPLNRPQGINSFGINSTQQARGTDSPNAAHNSSLSRGNPFG